MQEKKYEFIKEKRKEIPVNKKKVAMQTGYVCALALLFGVIASIVIAFLQPKIEELLYPEKTPVVSIPEDEPTETATEETEADAEQEKPIDMVVWQPTIEDYQMLHNQLYAIGQQANRFVVTVTGIQSETDWFNNDYENRDQGSGIIIANNSQELLILTEKKIIVGAQEVYVTFIDDVTVHATMKQYDGNTGIAVLSVALSDIEETTARQISVAALGNSLSIPQGTLAIAVGSPMGVNFSILTGNITSTTNTISTVDANYNIFTTDIVASENGSGALINVKGEVIGLVMQDYSRQGDENTLTAVSISDLKSLIEKMSNGYEVAYMGLGISTVTSDIEKAYDIPRGVYIKEVKMDSPAMAAGLQSGDVIEEMDGTAIYDEAAYEKRMIQVKPGDKVRLIIKRQSNNGYVSLRCEVEASKLK
ncbi:MAG: trypsin-like peptidase domain-containing protein [Lachnospiraceae bacterium]|nr:trypsin-like peptidase domain-containing protein [Lachnospiraceae bacterium]